MRRVPRMPSTWPLWTLALLATYFASLAGDTFLTISRVQSLVGGSWRGPHVECHLCGVLESRRKTNEGKLRLQLRGGCLILKRANSSVAGTCGRGDGLVDDEERVETRAEEDGAAVVDSWAIVCPRLPGATCKHLGTQNFIAFRARALALA